MDKHKLAKIILSEYKKILKKYNIPFNNTIEKINVSEKINFQSVIDFVFKKEFYYSNDFQIITNDLIQLKNKYMKQNTDTIIRTVEFSNTGVPMKENIIYEGFFTNFFKNIFKSIEKDSIKKVKTEHPEYFDNVEKNKAKIKKDMEIEKEKMIKKYGITPEQYEKSILKFSK